MKLYICGHCRNRLYLRNSVCLSLQTCGRIRRHEPVEITLEEKAAGEF